MHVPLFADIITAERWLMIMPMAVLSNFLIYCVVNAKNTIATVIILNNPDYASLKASIILTFHKYTPVMLVQG